MMLTPLITHGFTPGRFDPDRWLPGSPLAARVPSAYVPFGWAPTACLGAGLGTFQLLALAHLLSTRFRVVLDHPQLVRGVGAAVGGERLHGFEGRRVVDLPQAFDEQIHVRVRP